MGLKQRMAEAMAVDENGNPLPVEDRKAVVESLAQADATAVELELPLTLPPRNVKRSPASTADCGRWRRARSRPFHFAMYWRRRNVVQRIAGVTAALEQMRKNNDLWEAHIRVRFDDAGASLESHRGWILQNEAELVGPDGQTVPYSSQETTHQSNNEIGLTYSFPLSSRRAIGSSSTKCPASSSPRRFLMSSKASSFRNAGRGPLWRRCPECGCGIARRRLASVFPPSPAGVVRAKRPRPALATDRRRSLRRLAQRGHAPADASGHSHCLF